ncbi:hypothetical protein BGZ76_005214, partial [Entomortierella beljakovae]
MADKDEDYSQSIQQESVSPNRIHSHTNEGSTLPRKQKLSSDSSSGSGHPDFTKVRDALTKYYEEHLRIQRVSGETHTLEKCYINLAVVKAIDQYQIDREQLQANSETFIRMQSYENVRGTDLNSIIQIEDIFNKQKLRGGREDIPKKILIQGRA